MVRVYVYTEFLIIWRSRERNLLCFAFITAPAAKPAGGRVVLSPGQPEEGVDFLEDWESEQRPEQLSCYALHFQNIRLTFLWLLS